jgi:hypothetical protein
MTLPSDPDNDPPFTLTTNPIFKNLPGSLKEQTHPDVFTVVAGFIGVVTGDDVQFFPTSHLNSYFLVKVVDILYAEPVDPSCKSSPMRLFVKSGAELTFKTQSTLTVPARSFQMLQDRGSMPHDDAEPYNAPVAGTRGPSGVRPQPPDQERMHLR